MAEQKPTKAAATGVGYTKREAEVADVDLVSPHGTKIRVPQRRADDLLKRAPLELPDGTRRGYTRAGESEPKKAAPGGGSH